jgi:hypothetical protein
MKQQQTYSPYKTAAKRVNDWRDMQLPESSLFEMRNNSQSGEEHFGSAFRELYVKVGMAHYRDTG